MPCEFHIREYQFHELCLVSDPQLFLILDLFPCWVVQLQNFPIARILVRIAQVKPQKIITERRQILQARLKY